MADERTDAAGPGEPERQARGRSAPPAGPPERREYRGTRIPAGAVVAALLAIAVIIFIAQNTGSVEMEWTVLDFSWPLAAVLLAALVVGAVMAAVVGLLWRHRRRRGLRQRRELERLREEVGEEPRRGRVGLGRR